MKQLILGFMASFLLWSGLPGMSAEDPDEVLVTASPLPGSGNQLGRAVQVVDVGRLAALGGSSVGDAIEGLTSVSVGQRGDTGVQADLSLRGSTFQQVLLTLDGLPLTDPQTAHHNMDLPMPIAAIDRIMIIPGPGSALFGPSAFAGVVDLVPGSPAKTGLQLRGGYGSFDTRRAGATAAYVAEGHTATFSIEYSDSDGFQDGNDYEVLSLWLSTVTEYAMGSLRCSAGQTFKDFGARDFYAAYPSREETAVTFVDVAPLLDLGDGWALKINARYREHEDDFVLLDYNPSFYRNEHSSESFTERVLLSSPVSSLGTVAMGLERTDSMLESSNLGDRDAYVNSVFAQHRVGIGIVGVDLGLRVDDHDRWGTEVSPSVGMSVQSAGNVGVSMAIARGIRPPSFTELYYNDPANAGDENLQVEESWGGEVSLTVKAGDAWNVMLTYFQNEADGLIDWVRASSNDLWQASNIGETTTIGVEIAAQLNLGVAAMRPSYRYTDLDADASGQESKYALNVAEHDAGLSAVLSEIAGFKAAVSVRYRDVPTLDSYWLLAAKVSRDIGPVTVYASGKNLLDEEYEEIPGVPTAGTYTELGLRLAL